MTEEQTSLTPDSNYWRRKLDAFMHDNLSKPLDVKSHEMRAFQLKAADMIQPDERFDKHSDFWAAAADRLPFPSAAHLKAPFDGAVNTFKHPLAEGVSYQTNLKIGADAIDTLAQDNRTHLDISDSRVDFIARWRFWRLWTQSREPATAFFPADTRIPDHSIWNHLGITSAFQGCFGSGDQTDQPALLLFSIGPVQPMIAAARRIGDLWSGSYLLSYLTSVGLAEIAKRLGPDHVLFPSAWGQPLLDLQLKSLYQQAKVTIKADTTLWDSLWQGEDAASRQRYLLPSLPNRFLALVPTGEAAKISHAVQTAITNKLQEIGNSVDKLLEPKIRRAEKLHYYPERIEKQLANSLEMHWQTLTLPKTIEEAENWAEQYLPGQKDGQNHPSLEALRGLKAMWETLPREHRTGYGLKTPSSAWPVSFSLLSWGLDAVKQSRVFTAWSQNQSGWRYGVEQNKDDLNGRDEVVLSLPADATATQKFGTEIGATRATFRANERLGALTLVKRLWHLTYLMPRYGFKKEDFRMPDTHQLSRHAYDQEEEPRLEAGSDKAGYIAVLALDGDEMGKWISGEKTPPIGALLADKAREYFEKNAPDFLSLRRPLNPSFHLQFSEALANFGLYTAGNIVKAHAGRLIYAGGDDVLALLPADRALACAKALRRAFRGEPDREDPCDQTLYNLEHPQVGFLRLKQGDDLTDLDPVRYDILLPGPGIDVSVGIAIGHAASPLQDLVRAAQTAEKRAKTEHGRAALALSIFKRSGEIQHWGCKWSAPTKAPHPGLELLQTLIELLSDKRLESRFPHKVIARIEPYLGAAADRDQTPSPTDPHFASQLNVILEAEFNECLGRSSCDKGTQTQLETLFNNYLQVPLPPEAKANSESGVDAASQRLLHLLGLMRTAAWIARTPSAER